MKRLEKITWWIIATAAGLILLTPLLVDNNFMFPFITTKVLWFRLLVELMAGAYVLLLLANPSFRPRMGALGILLTLFIVSAAISSFTGPSPYVSFWGTIERGEGLVLWLHLWVYFVIMTSVFRDEKTWRVFFEIFLGVTVLAGAFGLGQALKAPWLLNTSGSRVDATFGNASFFAGYMLFAVAIAAYLFFKHQLVAARLYYAAVALLAVWAIFASGTRGAVFGLVGGIVVVAALLAWTARSNKVVRLGSIALIGIVLVSAGILFIGRNQSWVKESKLRRFISFSVEDKTIRNRLAAWGAAWQGWKERPLIGYGFEQFGTVFNRFFPPRVYDNQGSQVWFDHAHNLIFDRGLTTGFLGLLLYLAFIFYPGYSVLRRHLKNPDQRVVALIVTALIAAFVIQDLFVFETIAIYTTLFFMWAFLAATGLGEGRTWLVPSLARNVWIGVAIAGFIFLLPTAWMVNIQTGKVNRAAAVALRSDIEKEDFFEVVDRYKQVLASGTYGQQEYRVQYIDLLGQFLAKVGPILPSAKARVHEVIDYTDDLADRQVTEFGYDTKNLLIAMRHYNYTNNSFPEERVKRLEKALTYFDRLRASSPTRPHVYQEAGYTHLYLFRAHRDRKEEVLAAVDLAEAEKLFEQALALNPRVVESYINLVMLYLNADQPQKIYAVVDRMKAAGANYRRADYLPQLIQLAKNNQSDEWVINFTQEILNEEPNNLQALVTQATAYGGQGNRDKAIEIIERIKRLDASTGPQMDELIKKIQTGQLEQERNKKRK